MQTKHLLLELNDSGEISLLADRAKGRHYLPKGVPAPLLTLRIAGKDRRPKGLEWLEENRLLRLSFVFGAWAEIAIRTKPTHLSFELKAIESAKPVELVTWGPYPTAIGETIGETVGVVRDRDFAIGIQALNAKTLGGRVHADDVMPSYDIFDGGDYSDVSLDFKDKQLYRGDTAVAAPYGSLLQAYCRDRSQDRLIANWGHECYEAPAYEDGGVVGSKIVLFGCPTDRIMPTLEAIELKEGLPHPLIKGEWAKTSRRATASYVIMDFGEETIAQAIAATQAAGLEYLYHSSPFETWGHFRLKPSLFPNGWDGFKRCVDQAAAAGLQVGFHTLSNFTTTNDPYVTPKPDPRLARIGSSALTKTLGTQAKTIGIDDPAFFKKKTTLNAVVVGDEIITYKRISSAAPWKLLGCDRGAFGTQAAVHEEGTQIGKLMDHGYRVFLTDADLAQEQARCIADFCNKTGAMQLSFDGLEGNWSTGMGQYGRTLFTQAWYEALNGQMQGQVINDASNPGHFNWHIYTRMNWGEPWYAGFRESQTLYRLKNQYYYSRNLMPRMLGWFALRGDTSVEDAEWLLARAAGFDAGFSLATSIEFAGDQILPGNKIEARRVKSKVQNKAQSNLQTILATVKLWEAARMAGVFPETLKPALQDVDQEFHLEKGKGGLKLYRVHSVKAKLHAAKRTVAFDNPYAPQSLGLIVQNVGEKAVAGLGMVIGKQRVRICRRALRPDEKMKVAADGAVVFYDANWGVIKRGEAVVDLRVDVGMQTLRLDWTKQQAGQALKIELRTLGEPTHLGSD
jgi:hypothetical protein